MYKTNIAKSLDVTTEDQNLYPIEKTNHEERFQIMQEQIEQRLASKFDKMFEEKVSEQFKGVSVQINTITNRLGNLENKVVGIEKVHIPYIKKYLYSSL